MKEIICPYNWFCGEKFEPSEMSKHDFDFLESAKVKGMTFIIIHCPKCLAQFQFNPIEWKATAMISDPNKKVIKDTKPIKELLTTLKESDIQIPESYLDFLTSENFKSKISIIRGQEKFNLYNLNELCEEVNIDGNSCLRINELKGYADSLREVFGDENTEDFSLTELSSCLAIGYENEAILFLDFRDSNSLWVFYPDGGDIYSTKMTLEKIIRRK